MNLGEKIKFYRNFNHMSQKQLANLLKISFQSISKWEKNQSIPSIGHIMQMCNIFKISIDRFLNKNSFQDLLDNISNSEITVNDSLNFVQMYFDENIKFNTYDPIWEINALKLIKASIACIKCQQCRITISKIRDILLLSGFDSDRQQKLIKRFQSENDIIKENAAAVLEVGPNTFNSYISITRNLLEKLN